MGKFNMVRTDDKLVSIIVPVYNVEKYFTRCINSLISQTYKNIEIILIDDGSTDNSGKLCDEASLHYGNKVVVIHKKNEGLSDARNTGIKIAKGYYIAFVDSDDFVSNDMIQTMVSDLQKYNVDIACIGFQEFSDETFNISSAIQENHIDIYDRFQAIKILFSNTGFCNFSWNKLYKAELFLDIKFPYGRKMEDLGTTYLLFEKSQRILYNHQKLYYYNQHHGSILHNINDKFYIDKFALTTERYFYLKNKYGDFHENINYFITTFFQCYSYIENDSELKIVAENELTYLSKKAKKLFTMRRIIKIFIFRLNKSLYKLLFNSRQV